jgi:hypothetical protein
VQRILLVYSPIASRQKVREHVNEPPPSLGAEIHAEIAKVGAEIASERAAAGTEPAGEAGEGGSERGQVGQVGAEPEREPGIGSVGEEHAEVGAGRGGATAEGGPDTSGRSQQRPRAAADTKRNPLGPDATTKFSPNNSQYVNKAGNIRLDNLTTREDVKQVIRDAADGNNDFIGRPAR